MEHTRSGSDILVRLDPGEEIHTSLKQLADDLRFNAAAITSGIGRTRENQYGYMNEEGIYKRRLLDSRQNWSVYPAILHGQKMETLSLISTVVGLTMIIMYTQDICLNQQFML